MPKYDTTKLWDKEWYAVDALKTLQRESPETLAEEYRRLKNVADKRLERLERKYDWTKTYQNNEEGFKRYSEIDPRDLPKEMHELYKFVAAGTSTYAGQKAMEEKTTETLNRAIGAYDENGDFVKDHARVTHANYQRVIRILDKARKFKVNYGSEKIVELSELSLHMSNIEFDQILDNLEKLLPNTDIIGAIPMNDLKGYSFADVISKIGG